MKFTSAVFALIAICGATGAEAAVRYEFTTTGTYGGNVSYGSFSFTTSNYISSYGGLNPANFESCMVTQPVSNTCAVVYFGPATGPGGAYSSVQFVSETPSGIWSSSQFLFAGGAVLGTPGTYTSYLNPIDPFSLAVVATLRVSDVAAAVPEPASWALMLAGFGLMGAALRTRRRVGAHLA